MFTLDPAFVRPSYDENCFTALPANRNRARRCSRAPRLRRLRRPAHTDTAARHIEGMVVFVLVDTALRDVARPSNGLTQGLRQMEFDSKGLPG